MRMARKVLAANGCDPSVNSSLALSIQASLSNILNSCRPHYKPGAANSDDAGGVSSSSPAAAAALCNSNDAASRGNHATAGQLCVHIGAGGSAGRQLSIEQKHMAAAAAVMGDMDAGGDEGCSPCSADPALPMWDGCSEVSIESPIGLGRAYWGPKVPHGQEEGIPINPMRGPSSAEATGASSSTAAALKAEAGGSWQKCDFGDSSMVDGSAELHEENGGCLGLEGDASAGPLTFYNWACEAGAVADGEGVNHQQQQQEEGPGGGGAGRSHAGSAQGPGHLHAGKQQWDDEAEAVEEILTCLVCSLEIPYCDEIQPFSFFVGSWQVDRVVDQLFEEVARGCS